MNSDPLNLKEIEKKAFRSFHRDGFWEIFFGMLMFAGVVRDTLPKMGASVLLSQIVSITLTLSGIDRMIHEPARLLILATLFVVESADFLFLMNQTGLTRGNLSSHLSKLEAAGYVEIKKEFVKKIPRTLLSLTKSGRKAFKDYRQNMKQVLDNLPE